MALASISEHTGTTHTHFRVQAGGNLPLYGICMYSEEVLHRPPVLARERYSNCKAPYRQCLIAAPRCYCILSQYPFFPLHFQVSSRKYGDEAERQVTRCFEIRGDSLNGKNS